MRRAIFFSENEPVVKFVWVKATCDESDEDGPSETVDLKSYFSDTAGLEPQFRRVGNGRPLNVNVNALRDNRRLKSTIDIRHRDTFLIDGSKVNQGVLAVTKGKGHEWRGPMVALKEKKKRGVYDPYSFYDDIGMEDFRDVVDYLMGYGEQGRGWWVPGKDPE